ncbi:PQQ-binding-like beta-propeller repeat protein [Devosia sp. XK-2]|uniref:outer membrane protein assembly factor BamB family protein n=1 Tax=Devosia sp. XK-2 TaxID=3126689 RepID=UPI0030D2FC39
MTDTTTLSRDSHPAGRWYAWGLGVLVGLLGALILVGGVWLATLGGSWYYLVAGLGLLATAAFLVRRDILAVWTYLATYLFTVLWALWEVGLDGWAQVPRLVAPSVILVLVLLAIPALRRRWRFGGPYAAGPAALAIAGFAAAIGLVGPANTERAIAQETVTPAPDASAPVEPVEPPAPEAAPDVEVTPPDPRNVPQPPAEAEPAEPAAPTTPTGVQLRAAAQTLETGADWPAYGGTYQARRFSPLADITPGNVDRLERVWEYRSGDMPSQKAEGKYSPENTPLKVGDDLYICSAMGIAISVDAATGREEWRFDPEVPEDAIPYGATCRGVAYYTVPDAEPDALCATRIIWGTLDARLIAVDAQLGQPCPDFGENGEVYLEDGIGDTVPGWYSITSAPTIVRGIVVTGAQVQDGQAEDSPSGVVRGYDAVTGQLAWAWDLGNPDNRGAPAEGEVYTRGTPNMWTTAAADEERGLVYLPLGNSAVDYYGSNRSELENEYATSLVAVDVTTGEDIWHFQTVHRDVWDYDLGSQPSLVDFPTDSGTVPAIILSSKQGDIYVLNRETGEPLFPVEEREVPTGTGVEPGYLSPTQPFSTYHSLLFPALEEKDMWGMSPLDQLWCRIQFRMANYEGAYTPPTSDGRWIQYPGYNGGQDWGSMAVDIERGILVANYNDMPNYNRLIPREEAGEAHAIFEPEYEPGASEAGPQLGSPYAISVNAGWRESWTGLMCKQPPYGGLRAIDLETGETLWDVPLGTARANGPFRIPSMLPLKIGTPNNGGPLVTAGGLIFIAAATDNLIRAIDIETGETVWSDVLPAGGQTTPITYSVGDRQFIAIAPGGHHFMETPIGDYLIAWALPEED